jgi:allantoicase
MLDSNVINIADLITDNVYIKVQNTFYSEVDNIKEDGMCVKYTKFQSPNGRGITAWESRRRRSILLK